MTRRSQEPRDLNERLIEFANSLLDAAEKEGNLAAKVDAFKAVTTFFASVNKRAGKGGDERDGQVANFEDFRQRVAEAGGAGGSGN